MRYRIGKKLFFDRIACIILSAILWFMAVNYCDLTDYRVYYREYMSVKRTGETGRVHLFEIGYAFLNKLFARYTTWYIFYGIFISVILLLFFRFYRKYCKYNFLLILVLAVWPYILILQQIRSAFAGAIVMNALGYLLKQDDRMNKIKYVFWIIVASTIHVTSVIFILFIFMDSIDVGIIKKTVMRLFFLVPIIAFFLKEFTFYILTNVSIFQRLVYTLNLNERSIPKAPWADWLFYGFLLLVFLFGLKMYNRYFNESTFFFIKISLTLIALSLLRFVTDSAYRIAAMHLPVIYLTLVRMGMEIPEKKGKVIFYSSIIFFAAISLFTWFGPLNPAMNDILLHVMWRVRSQFAR